ncbi:hypothetical protein I5Q34_22805 [Streptomyces sp. AV19]|uniref:DUF6255 family natural product biosynthesis protein n=1 Tax=Streptomyces sp. AV19 TaxID=2793068 RepID=UPI0018FEF247|nr:DUF6255 family natural product biosynthesis protein [Streptomyces sp. AV19]MBH1937062.1 hypothetical protein [Streptomyces sp. AV19]MDG4535901.1 DUF6255 family natural product biosynthesis protein [Streptomyces sp. AV19]
MAAIAAANCRHPGAGWRTAAGVETCTACGVRRFPTYASLRPAAVSAERPAPLPPELRTVSGTGVARMSWTPLRTLDRRFRPHWPEEHH